MLVCQQCASPQVHSTLVEERQAKHSGKAVLGAICTISGTKQFAQRAYKLKERNECLNPHWRQIQPSGASAVKVLGSDKTLKPITTQRFSPGYDQCVKQQKQNDQKCQKTRLAK